MARADAVEVNDMVDEKHNLIHANLGVSRDRVARSCYRLDPCPCGAKPKP
jgi:hypothetical protein